MKFIGYFYSPIRISMRSKILKSFLVIILVVVILFVTFLVWLTMADFKPENRLDLKVNGSTSAYISAHDTLRIVSWNLGYAGLGREMDFFYDGGKQVSPSESYQVKYFNGITEWLLSGNLADIYLFQEVDINSRRSFHADQYEMLRQSFGDYASSFALNYKVPFVPMPIHNPMGKVTSGLATFSRATPDSSFRFAFPGNYSWPTGLFFPDRCFILNDYSIEENKRLIIINTHNSAFDDGNLRKAQLGMLRDMMVEYFNAGYYVIAGGDWNINPPGIEPFRCTTGDAIFEIEPALKKDLLPAGWTWIFDPEVPTGRFLNESYMRGRTHTTIIDYFVVSPNVEALDIECFDLYFENSDHHPVKIQALLR